MYIHCYQYLHQRAINQSLKVASYHTQKIINVLLLKSLLKLMFSKLKQFITFGIFWFLFNTQAYLVQMKVSNDKDQTGDLVMER
jgi:type III secretory pathway component EscU